MPHPPATAPVRAAPAQRAARRYAVTLLAAGLYACDGDSPASGLIPADVVDALDAAPDPGDTTDHDSGTDGSSDAETAPDAQPGPAFPPALAAQLDAVLAEYAPQVAAPGLTVTVELADGAQWIGAWGVRSTVTGEATQPDDRFRIGSITKTFVASVVHELAEDGAFDLDGSVAESLPELGLDARITPRMLLGHTSGIVDYTDVGDFVVRAQQAAAPEEVIAYAMEQEPLFAPGTGWSYSNTGYYVLGLLLEQTLGDDIAGILREYRLDRLGLNDTFLQPNEEVTGGFADGHLAGAENTGLVHMSWAWAAGGMVSDGDDLCRWARAVFGDTLHSGAARQLLTERIALSPDNERYGLGIRIARRAGVDVWGHTGSTIGFRGELFFDNTSATCVAVLTNDFFADQLVIAEPVWQAVVDRR